MKRPAPQKTLLVEGTEDVYVMGNFCNERFGWENEALKRPAVKVKSVGSDTQLLDASTLMVHLQEPGTTHLGLVIDGDGLEQGVPRDRWTPLCTILREAGYSDLPDKLPGEGLHLDRVFKPEVAILPRFSLWVMPDNKGPGSWETLLWESAEEEAAVTASVRFPRKSRLQSILSELPLEVKKYAEIHAHKSRFRTWLAWSSVPDTGSGIAVKSYFARQDLPGLTALKVWLDRAFKDSPPESEAGT